MIIHQGGMSPWLNLIGTALAQLQSPFAIQGAKSPGDLVFISNGFLTLGQGSGPVLILSLRWMTGFKMESLLLFSHWPQQNVFQAHMNWEIFNIKLVPGINIQGFPCGSAGKETTCSAGDLGLIPGLERSPGEGVGYPLQYSGLENFMDSIAHRIAKSRTRLRDFHFHFINV